MKDSLKDLEYLCNSKQMHCHLMIVLTKKDIFEKKFSEELFSKTFPEFTGNEKSGLNFIETKIKKICGEKLKEIIYFNSFDKSNSIDDLEKKIILNSKIK